MALRCRVVLLALAFPVAKIDAFLKALTGKYAGKLLEQPDRCARPRGLP